MWESSRHKRQRERGKERWERVSKKRGGKKGQEGADMMGCGTVGVEANRKRSVDLDKSAQVGTSKGCRLNEK